MSTIIWANTDWHCWSMPLTGYPVSEPGNWTPEAGFHYQINRRNHDRFSMLTDAGVADLTASVKCGGRLMRWRLQHFTDRHADKLDELIRLGAFAEPDLSSIGLAMIAYRHWEQFGNLLIAEVLVLHMLRMEYTVAEIMDELYAEQILRGESRDDGFAAFVANCGTALQYENLSDRLKPKASTDAKKVKI